MGSPKHSTEWREPLRVGWIVTPLFKEGGTFTHLRRWAEGFRGTSIRPTLFYFSPNPAFSRGFHLPGVEVMALPALDLRGRRVDKAAIHLARVARRAQIDLLHSIYIGSDLVGLIASRLSGIPIVSTVEGALFVSTMSPGARYGAQMAYRALSRRFRVVMPVSHATGRELDGLLSSTVQRHVVYPGVPIERFRPPPSLLEGPRLAVLGRLAPIKGVPLLVEAVHRLIPRIPKMKVTLIGDGPDREPLRALIRSRGLGHVFEMTGWTDSSTVQHHLRHAHLLVLPSYSEGMPWAALEAMALGLPVVASRVGGLPELIVERNAERCGWLFEAGERRSLTALLAEILEAPDALALLARVGRAAHARVSSAFRAQKEIAGLRTIYLREGMAGNAPR